MPSPVRRKQRKKKLPKFPAEARLGKATEMRPPGSLMVEFQKLPHLHSPPATEKRYGGKTLFFGEAARGVEAKVTSDGIFISGTEPGKVRLKGSLFEGYRELGGKLPATSDWILVSGTKEYPFPSLARAPGDLNPHLKLKGGKKMSIDDPQIYDVATALLNKRDYISAVGFNPKLGLILLETHRGKLLIPVGPGKVVMAKRGRHPWSPRA